VAQGKSAWEIGKILRITKRTVDEHVQSGIRKVGAANRTHAVVLAIRERFISISDVLPAVAADDARARQSFSTGRSGRAPHSDQEPS
jgi:hypothetical protein